MQNKQKLSTNNLIALLAVATVLIVVGCGVAGKVLFGNMQLNAKVISKKTLANDTLQKNIDAYQKLHDQVQQLGTQVAVAEDALPTDVDFTAIASQIEQMAGQNGVALKTVALATGATVAASSAPGSATSVPFTINFESSYVNATRMMAALELSARPMHVQSVSITGGAPILKFDVLVNSYYQDKADISNKTETVK